MGLRSRIALLFGTGLLAAFLLTGWLVDSTLRADLEDAARRELRNAAFLVVHGVGDETFSDALADRLAAGTGLRVTLIGPDGTVLGDSEVPAERLPTVENHASRPEVRSALDGREGVAARPSGTISRRLLYFAVPHEQGVVRLSEPTDGRGAIVAKVRGILAAGAIVALLIALGVGRLAIRMVAGSVQVVRETAEAIAAGDLSRRSRAAAPGELGALGRAIDDMADGIEDLVADLRREQADLAALFESRDDGLAVLDDHQVVVRANRAFREIVGRQDIEGERLISLFRSPEVLEVAGQALSGDQAGLEARVRYRTMLVTGVPHGDGALIALKDLTALRQLEGVWRDFVANVSHELKTPLTTVMGFAEPIADGATGPEETRAFGRRILLSAQRMRSLIQDLLDLSRIEAGSWRPSPESLDLGAAAREAWASLEPAPGKRNVRLAIRPDDPVDVTADPGAVMQILRNLLENAARYAPEGSDVEVVFGAQEGVVRVEVRDSGSGIPPLHQRRVFERFYRVDPARSRKDGGTGLGLSIVKHLAAAQGGEVGIVSDIGQGTTVWFTLPA